MSGLRIRRVNVGIIAVVGLSVAFWSLWCDGILSFNGARAAFFVWMGILGGSVRF